MYCYAVSGYVGIYVLVLILIFFAIIEFQPLFQKDSLSSVDKFGILSRFSLLSEKRPRSQGKSPVPLIIAITPTYQRPTRFADITRMANTLRLVPHLHWILVEDANETVPYVRKILERSTIPFTYLAAGTEKGYPRRGWFQRTVALRYLRKKSISLMKNYKSGVVYFADDDNSYDIRLFTDYIRHVKRLGLWAVGLSGRRPVEYPVVSNGSVIRFEAWLPSRLFATDMAGFAVNLNILLNSTVEFGKGCKKGFNSPETCFLSDLGFERKDIEPFGWDSEEEEKEVLVWHTKTVSMKFNRTSKPLPYAFE
ncbi:hypothetical protein Y032_0200g1683 [Ancylostoma ceylanicum]|uniref:Galactosylgalactosylxylosylprotein 3-beta-glucuronosyltransferase n=1 Tax=Ancylostoma ceylanicum TaxID=53326 RepID=A0A016SNF8_9BILA|nr:hypothetical protein Y032_0200g1683 [Ancylostoma ceylanicum]